MLFIVKDVVDVAANCPNISCLLTLDILWCCKVKTIAPIIATNKIKEARIIHNQKSVYKTAPIVLTLLLGFTQVYKGNVGGEKYISDSNINKTSRINTIPIIRPIGTYLVALSFNSSNFIFNIITTKRKRIAIAPTYTIIKRSARNSTPKSIIIPQVAA